MGRNKMEKDFSEKLNQREIIPSANAWDRLDAMLAVAEEKENKPKRNFGWIYIAASIVGFLLIGTVFLNSTEEVTDVKKHEVVLEDNPKLRPTPSDLQHAAHQDSIASTAIAETPTVKDSNSHSKTAREIQNVRKQTNESQLAENSINQNSINQNNINQNQGNQNQIINQKINSVPNVVLANNLQADELLAMAQTKSNAETSKASVKVNARNLLSQVDGELDQTFREKVINSVGKNYRNAKVALANRNNLEEENH